MDSSMEQRAMTRSDLPGRWLPHWQRATTQLEFLGMPLLLLAARIWIGLIFFNASWARITNWGSQEFLFTQIHPVPFLPAALAAPMITAGELGLAILLMAGLAGRFSALGLLVMTAVIQFVVGQTPQGQENAIANPVHYFWMFLLLLVLIRGPGLLSLDALLCRLIPSFGRKA
ncbi:DoxX family protein [Fodinicurvata fenggangensis]|uniref:DoxX family protein n=1 Tax=Fodinicurvata fenggangensis TaxID=1121830 RepID=UPI0009DE5DA4|nr:DoxX family protein [Fodinicurvata fenggangensis]